MRMFITALVCLHLLAPIAVWSQAVVKTPLSYSLQEYGIVLGTALLGGLASCWRGVMHRWAKKCLCAMV